MPPLNRTLPYRLFNEDALEVMRRLDDSSVDLILVDPPYGTTQCSWDSVIPIDTMWMLMRRVLKMDGIAVVMANQPFTSVLVCSNLDWFKYAWTWNKVNRVTGFLDCKNRPLRVVEDILVFCRSTPKYRPQMTQGTVYKTTHGVGAKAYGSQVKTKYESDGLRYPINLLNIKGDERGTVGRLHPTQKPVELMEYLVKTYTDPGETVLDFAMGSGTTGVACGNLGRKFIGIDNDKEHGYFDIATLRVVDAYQKGG